MLCAAAGCHEAASTSTLSQRKRMITEPLSATSMTCRKPSPSTTGNSKAKMKLLAASTHTHTYSHLWYFLCYTFMWTPDSQGNKIHRHCGLIDITLPPSDVQLKEYIMGHSVRIFNYFDICPLLSTAYDYLILPKIIWLETWLTFSVKVKVENIT